MLDRLTSAFFASAPATEGWWGWLKEGGWFVAKSALFRSVFVDILFHGLIIAGLVCLEMLSHSDKLFFLLLLVDIDFFVV